MSGAMPFVVLFLGIALLLVLIIRFKINTFLALVITAVLVALGLGMPMDKIALSVQTGIGSQLGELSIVFGFGAMLGRLVADAGGAFRIATTLIHPFCKVKGLYNSHNFYLELPEDLWLGLGLRKRLLV